MMCAVPRCGPTCMVSGSHRYTWPAVWLRLILGMKPGCRIKKRHPALLPAGPNLCYRPEIPMPCRNRKGLQEHGRTGWRSKSGRKQLNVSPMGPHLFLAGDILFFPGGRCLHRNFLPFLGSDFGRPDSSQAAKETLTSLAISDPPRQPNSGVGGRLSGRTWASKCDHAQSQGGAISHNRILLAMPCGTSHFLLFSAMTAVALPRVT